MAESKLDRIIREIDGLTPVELANGLRLAAKAYAIKAGRVAGTDRQWMQGQTTRIASALLNISTGGMPL